MSPGDQIDARDLPDFTGASAGGTVAVGCRAMSSPV